MATIDDVQKNIQDLRLFLADNMATKQDLRLLEERFDEKFATKEEVRNYATWVENAIGEQKDHRIEHYAREQRYTDLEEKVNKMA